MRDPPQLAPLVAFFHLPIDQAHRHLPLACFPPLAIHLEPLSKVSGEGIEVQIEAITGEDWEAAGSQDLSQGVDHSMSQVLCTRTELKHRQNLGEGIDGQPEPQHLLGAAEPGAQLVQLEVRELEMKEEALVQGVRVLASTG
jgi:hypothetical protein